MKTVVIADEEANMRACLAYLMKRAGFAVREAFDGDGALAAVRNGELPDLILLAVDLDGRDGYEVCQTLRNDPQTNAIRILMVSSKALAVEKEKGMALGADAYVTKPFSNRKLVDQAIRLAERRI